MAVNSEHASIILKRVFDSHDPSEQIVLISGKDKIRVPIHRVILNAASKYFADMFGPNFQEGKPEEFLLVDSDGGTIKDVVNFCYTGHIDLTDENVERCLAMASSVEIDLLEDKCRQFLSSNLSVANSVSILMIAEKYRFGDLRNQAFNLVCDEFGSVPSTDIQKLSRPLLEEILKCDRTQEYGDLCTEFLLEWFQYDEEERGEYMPKLLRMIRLEKLTPEFLSDTLEAVFKSFKCSDLVNAEYKRRATSKCVNKFVHRFPSMFCVLKQYKDDIGGSTNVVIIEEYNNVRNCSGWPVSLSMGHRSCFEAILLGTKVFVLGGKYTLSRRGMLSDDFSKSVFSFCLSSSTPTGLPEMNVARCDFTTILLGKYIYVMAGRNSENLISCERFDTEKNTWEIVKSMNYHRELAAAATLNGYIYIAGGMSNEHGNETKVTSSVDLYDPKNDDWTKVAPMNKGRCGFALVASNGFLYAMGHDAIVERFDPYKNCWTMIGSFDGSAQITSSIDSDGELFAFMKNGEFGRVEVDGGGKSSFIAISKSIFNSRCWPRSSLFHVKGLSIRALDF